MIDLSIEQIRELLDYNPETGIFIWRQRAIRPGALARIDRNWNARFSGKQVAANVASQTGYSAMSIFCKRYNAHRIAWAHFYGSHPALEVDHINGDKIDNRICNLRLASRSQNAMNCKRKSNNTSGYKGVSFHKAAQKWHARICVDYKTLNLGLFATVEEAYTERLRAEQKLHGEFSLISSGRVERR